MKIRIICKRVPSTSNDVHGHSTYINLRQKKMGPFWITQDSEIIPNEVVMNWASTGVDHSGWHSRLST